MFLEDVQQHDLKTILHIYAKHHGCLLTCTVMWNKIFYIYIYSKGEHAVVSDVWGRGNLSGYGIIVHKKINVISVWGDSFNDKQDVWGTKIHTWVRNHTCNDGV